LGLGGLAVTLSRLIVSQFTWARQLHMEFHVVLRGLTGWQALVIALASAVGEEALFRGAMVPTLGLWLSSVIFGVVHVPVRRGLWPWPLLAFGLGLAFGAIYVRTGDLTGPILAHFVINYFNLRHISRTAYPEAAPPEPAFAPPPPSGDAAPPAVRPAEREPGSPAEPAAPEGPDEPAGPERPGEPPGEA
jgi:membrane protease YdiL (CAAX protease family)